MKARFVGLTALALSLLAISWAGSQYFGQRLTPHSTGSGPNNSGKNNNSTTITPTSAKVSVLISFGDGRRVWFNDTVVPITYNYYNVTYKIANGDIVARWSSAYNAHFVYEILGVGCVPGDINCAGYWSLWIWNEPGSCWDYSTVGVDLLQVSTVGRVAWHFLHYDGSNQFQGKCS